AHGAAEARVDSQLDFRQTDLGGGGHDTVIGRQAHLETATQGDAVDGDDGRHAQVFEIAEDLVRFEVAGDQFLVRELEVVDEFGDVCADDEHDLAAGDDDVLNRSFAHDVIDRLAQFVEGDEVEIIDCLI